MSRYSIVVLLGFALGLVGGWLLAEFLRDITGFLNIPDPDL